MKDIVIETQHLTKIYNYHSENEFEALHDINIQIHKGEFTAVMGPSGAGKSTFINTISTLDLPTKGKVFINGTEVRQMGANEIGTFRHQNLGFIFQEFNLLDTHTLYENIAMPMALAHADKEAIRSRVHELASALSIEQCLMKYPNECSGGQRQRAAICRALVNHPGIIAADEPTGNLDSKNSMELMKIFLDMHAKGVTLVMVTHDPLISSYAERLLYIRDGRIETILKRGDMDQDDYFQQIVALNSRESREILKK